MRLTLYSDFSLRVLIYLAVKEDNKCTINEVSEKYGISKNHLRKVVHNLSKISYIKSIRGRSGGLVLALPPSEIIIGDVVRLTEDDFRIAECFNQKTSCCVIQKECTLKKVLNEALDSFLDILDKYTLEDIAEPKSFLRKSLGIK